MSTTEQARRSAVALSDRRTTVPKMLRAQFAPKRVSLFKPVNVGLMAELAANRHGRVPIYLDQPFTWDPQQRIELDYVEVATLVEQMSAALAQAGVTKRDRVVILKSPNYDIQSLAWAAARIGAIPALLSARLDPNILQILLERIDARFIVTDPEVAARVGLTAQRLRELNCTAIASIDGGIPVADLWGGPIPAANPGRNDEPMMITHTSSTTGVSKLAEASATGVGFSAFMESVFPFLHSPEDLFASVISHVHVRAAVTQQAAFSRGTPLLGIGGHDDATIVDLFSRYRPTLVEGHPNAYVGWEKQIDHPSSPFASVRLFMNTFDAIHPRTIRRLLEASQRANPVWYQCYGMTEVQVVTVRPYTLGSTKRAGDRDSRSVGWMVPGVRARIADPDTGRRRADQGEPGMIQVKSRARALSFVGTPEKYWDRRHGKWFDTGDWGRKGKAGQLEVLDRVADRIAGVDSCLQLEDVLMSRIPDAEEIVVVPDEQGVATPVVCMRDGKVLDPQTWDTASAGLAGLGKPFEVTPEQLLHTATVKPRRYLITEMIKNHRLGTSEPIRQDVVLRDGA
ncbi:class I adenylate-forming enzyme family protein [Actinophytocola sediminis]